MRGNYPKTGTSRYYRAHACDTGPRVVEKMVACEIFEAEKFSSGEKTPPLKMKKQTSLS